MIMCSKTWIRRQRATLGCLLSLCFLMAACGGGSSKSPPPVSSFSSKSSSAISSAASFQSSSTSSLSSSGASSSAAPQVTISGTLTFDSVPHNNNYVGLDYGATERRPIRGVRVDLINVNNQILSQTQSDESGFYSLSAPANEQVRVRVVAQLLHQTTPSWNISVADNTQNDALYTLTGNLTASGATNSQRNLHAPSGWGGDRYSQPRAAAPFAILDAIYGGVIRLSEAGNTQNLPALTLFWSPANRPASNPDDDYSTGEIGTSFYYKGAIYLLGQQDEDTDEYDSHVILHEWVHYLEDTISRSNTIGGGHSHTHKLDMRVALSEGLANAMAGMMLDDSNYRDSVGIGQMDGFYFDISDQNHSNKGWYSEASVESVLYNYYLDDADKPARDLRYLVEPFTSSEYRDSNALTSIYLLSDIIENHFPDTGSSLRSLLTEQKVFGTGIYGTGETNNAETGDTLPVYHPITPGAVVNVCSNSQFGSYNKLGIAQFLRLTITQSASYRISVTKNGGESGATDPDFVVYRQGAVFFTAFSELNGEEDTVRNLAAGDYVLEVYDWKVRDSGSSSQAKRTCFDVRVQIQ